MCIRDRSKKQTAVSHSTPEAEIVAAAYGLRFFGEVILAMAVPLWKGAFNLDVKVSLYEDNETAYRIFKSGQNNTMRYLGRTHGVNLGYLAGRLNDKKSGMDIRKAESAAQRADIFTKCFTNTEWRRVKRNVSVLSVEEQKELMEAPPGDLPYLSLIHI